jgi:AcrR family transcriptional regulator
VSEPGSRWDTIRLPDAGEPGYAAAGARTLVGHVSSERIVDVAARLFATRGFDGTTIRDITREAGVNVGAVTYHFGSKRELYVHVLGAAIFPIRTAMLGIARQERDALGRIEAFVRAFFQHLRRTEHMVPLMVREMAGTDPLAPPVRQMLQDVMPAIAGVIREGQKAGTIRAGDPLLLALSTAAQPVYFNLARKALATVLGLDPNADAHFDRLVDHCVTTVKRQLTP